MTRYARCANAIFDEQWCEYKCSVKQRKVEGTSACVGCRKFKAGKPTTSTRESKDDER